MNMNWIETIFYGLFSGISDILPVSAQAHRMLLIALFGEEREPVILRLLIHIGTLAALYYGCQNHILRITRAVKLAKTPRNRRKRPLDIASYMDYRMLKTMIIPVIIGFLFHDRLSGLVSILSVLSFTLLLNGLILFVPQFLPGGNKESLSMSPLDGILMGAGAAASLIPGISCMGTALSLGIVRGGDKGYVLNMALLLNMAVMMGHIVVDILGIVSGGIGGLTFLVFLRYLACAAAAFGGTLLGITLMRKLAQRSGFGLFAYYSWGAALFAFLLFLSI